MDLIFSNSVFTQYLMGIPRKTRDKVFLNMSKLKTVKIRKAIRQIGEITRVNIERLSPQELKKYKRNNSHTYKAKPLSKKKDHEKSHSNKENPTDSLVASNSSNSSEEEHSSSDIESTDKESRLSLTESVETSLSKEDSISRIKEETELKPEYKEEISVSSPESVLSLKINTCDNKKKTEETSSLISKHSDKTKSHDRDLNTNNTNQSRTTKESTSYKIDQSKVDSNKDNKKINKPINTIPAHDKHKQKIINLFGDDEEIEIKIPAHKKTDTDEASKSDTTDESSKMKRNSTCENNQEKNIKSTQPLSKDNSAKTNVSKKITDRRKSTHHREESKEEDKRTQSKSRDKSNVIETKLVRSSSKEECTVRRKSTHHREDINEEKSKSRDKDISNDPKAVLSSSKLKDNREEIKARRKSIHHREESKEKTTSRSKSRDRDVLNSTSVPTSSKPKNSGKEVMARRKSIHCREESKDKETTRPRSKSREKDSESSLVRRKDIPGNVEKEKNKSKTQDVEKISSKMSGVKVARRQSIYQSNDSNEDNSKKEKNKPKSQDSGDKVKSLKSNKDEGPSKISSLKVPSKNCSEEKSINKKDALKIAARRKTVSHPVPLETNSDTNSDSSSDGPIIIIRKKSSTEKDISSKSQSPKRRKSMCSEPKVTSASDDSRIRNSSDKTKQKAKEDKKNDSLKTDNSGEEIKRLHSRVQEGKKSNSCNVSKPDKVLKKSSSSHEIICKDSKKSDSNEKRRCSESVSTTRDRSVSSKRSSSLTTSSSTTLNQNPSKLNLTHDKSSSSNTPSKRSKSTNQETGNSRSSSTTSVNRASSSSKQNLSRDESPLDKRRKSISQETRIKSSSSSKQNLLPDESSLMKRKKSVNQEETPNSSTNSSKVKNVNKDSSSEKNTQQKSNTVVSKNSVCIEKSSSDKNSCKTHKSAEKNEHKNKEDKKKETSRTPTKRKSVCIPVPEIITDTSSDATVITDNFSNHEQKNKEDKKKECSKTPTRRKCVCIPVPEIITDTSSDSTIITNDLSNSQTPKRSKTSSELESDSSSDVNLDAVKRKIFSSIAIKAPSLTRPTVAKDIKVTTPKKSSIDKDKSSTPKSSGVRNPAARPITKRRITVHQDNIEEELERIFDNSTPKRMRKEKTSMRKRSASICILPQCQETENNGVKRKRPPVVVIGSSDDSTNSEVTSNKRTKSGETPSSPTKNYLSYGDLEEQLKTTPSTSKTLDFVDPLSGSSSGFSKPNYDDDKTQDMTYDSVLIIEEKENTLPKILVRRKSVQEVEKTRERVISRRHSFHLDDIQCKEEPKDSDEEVNIAKKSAKQDTTKETSKDSSKPNKEPKRNILRRKSIHEISTQLQSSNDIRPIKSILKKRPLDSNETLPNVSNPSSTRQLDLNDNNITSATSVSVRIDLQSIDIDKMFPTENTDNAITLEISSEENSPTREENTSKSRLSIDSAIGADFDADKEAEVRTNVSNPNDNQTSENLAKLKIDLIDEIRFISTAQAVEAVKGNFVSLLYIYKQYFKMRARVDCEKKLGKEPNLPVRMAYFSKRRDSDLSKMYDKLITFKVDNFIINTFFELIAKYLKEEFKEYKEITEAVIHYFIQAIIWILTENFTSPSDDKFLFNHITSCDCEVFLLEKADKYLKNATILDKKINGIFKDFTFKTSFGTKQTETITRPSETPSSTTAESSTTLASSTVTKETVCSNTLKTITPESLTTKSCVEKTVPTKYCELMSSLTLDNGQLTVPPSKSVWPPLTQQIKNLSLPIIETEDQTSMKPNPPPKRRGRPPKNLQNIQSVPAPKKSDERKVTTSRRPNILKPIVKKPVIHKPIVQKKPPSPGFDGILAQINKTKSFLPSSSTPQNVMITVSSEAYLPSPATTDTTQAVRKFVTYAITFDSKSSSQAGLPQQTINGGLKNDTQSTKLVPQIIPCESHDQNLSSDDDLHIVEEMEEQQVDNTSNSQLTNEIISLLQHPNQKTTSIEPPKQRIITLDGLIVPQSKAKTVPTENKNISSSTVSVSAPVWTPMPAEVPILVTSTSQATSQNITKSTTSVTTPFCTSTTFSNRKLSYDAKQSALPPTFINQNQNSSQNRPQILLKTNNPTPQSTLTSMLKPTNQEQNNSAILKSNSCQNNFNVQNHLRDYLMDKNKPPPNKSNPLQATVGQNVPPPQKSVKLGHNNPSEKGPNPHSSNQVNSRSLYPNLHPEKMSNLTQNVTRSQIVPVSQNATLEGNVILGQNISSQSYQTTTHQQNNPMGQNIPPTSQNNMNLGQNDPSQNYPTPHHGQNNPMDQNLPSVSRDNVKLEQNDYSQNYEIPTPRRNGSMGQILSPTSRDDLNLGQNDSSQNYQTPNHGQNNPVGQNLPLTLRNNVNLEQNDCSQNYQTPNQTRNSSMGQNLPPTLRVNQNLGQNDSSQNYEIPTPRRNGSMGQILSPTSRDDLNLGQNDSSQNYQTPNHGQNNPVGQNLPLTLRNNVNLEQNDCSQNYQTPNQTRNSSMGQNLPPTLRVNQNLGQNDSSQNYQTLPRGQNTPMGQNLPHTSRDNLNLSRNDSLQNYYILTQGQNNSMDPNLPPVLRNNLNLRQSNSQNYQTSTQRRNSSMGQNLPPTSRDNLNLGQKDSSQNYQTPTQRHNNPMGQNMSPSLQGSVNLSQNTLSQNSSNLQDVNQRQNRRTRDRSSSLINVTAQNGSYMVQNNTSVPVSQHNQGLSQNNSNLTQNNNQSLIQSGFNDSQNNTNVLMNQNNKTIPQQSRNHVNTKENDLTRLKTLASVAKSGSLREKNNTPPQKRKYNQTKSPQNVNLGKNNQEMVRYAQNKNLEQVHQNYIHTETRKNNHLYQLMVQGRQQITQNNLTMAQNIPNNSVTYPHQMAMQTGIIPIHPNQMVQNGGMPSYPAQQMAPGAMNHQYPYEMVPQIPMYRTQITHAIHEPVYNNLDYMHINMTREALAQHDYYDRMLSEMERSARILPSYEDYLQAQRLQNDNNNRVHPLRTLEQMTQARVFRREVAHHLPQPFPAYGFNHQENHPTSELQPHQENHRRTESNTLPQPFPSHNSDHSNTTKPTQVQRPSNSNNSNTALEKFSTHPPVPSNYVEQLQVMTDKQIPPLQVPSGPKRPRLVRPNLHQIELLKQNLEQIVANTPTEKTTNRINNSALSSIPGHQAYDMDSVHISEGPPQPRPIKWRMKKNLQQDGQKDKSPAEENGPGNQMQVDVYNPALRNVSRDSGYFSPSDVAIQTLDVDGDVICDRCLAPSNLLCSGCYIIYYCSTECQELAWPEHMNKCLAVSPLQRR